MQNRGRLIQGATTVMAIVESLGVGTIVHPEIYAEIQAEKTRQSQMRLVFAKVLDPGGTAIRAAFYNALKQHQPHLSTTEKPGKITCTAKWSFFFLALCFSLHMCPSSY